MDIMTSIEKQSKGEIVLIRRGKNGGLIIRRNIVLDG